MLAAAVMPAKYRRAMTPALRMNARTTIAIAPAQMVWLATSPLNEGMMTWSVTRPSTIVPSTDVSANTDEPATDVANGPGCATMNRRKVATPRCHVLRSIVSGTCGYLVRTTNKLLTHAERLVSPPPLVRGRSAARGLRSSAHLRSRSSIRLRRCRDGRRRVSAMSAARVESLTNRRVALDSCEVR